MTLQELLAIKFFDENRYAVAQYQWPLIRETITANLECYRAEIQKNPELLVQTNAAGMSLMHIAGLLGHSQFVDLLYREIYNKKILVIFTGDDLEPGTLQFSWHDDRYMTPLSYAEHYKDNSKAFADSIRILDVFEANTFDSLFAKVVQQGKVCPPKEVKERKESKEQNDKARSAATKDVNRHTETKEVKEKKDDVGAKKASETKHRKDASATLLNTILVEDYFPPHVLTAEEQLEHRLANAVSLLETQNRLSSALSTTAGYVQDGCRYLYERASAKLPSLLGQTPTPAVQYPLSDFNELP